MPLTDISVRQAKPRTRPYKLSDGGGLMLLVQPNGAKWWRMRYRIEGREKMLSLGLYPELPLGLARERHAEARRQLVEGLDPSLVRKREKAGDHCRFDAVAREWLEKQKVGMSPATYRKARWMLEDLTLPKIGERPIAKLTAREILDVLEPVDAGGHHESAKRMRQRISQIFRYAIATSRADRDIAASLRGALRPGKVKHRAAIVQPDRVRDLLRAIWGYQGQPSTAAALKLAPLVFVRPGELRAAEWSEFDFANAMWRIPAHRMKMREEHLVPLARQAVEILKELHPLTGDGRYVFPAIGYAQRPISDNTINAALRRTSVRDQHRGRCGSCFSSADHTCASARQNIGRLRVLRESRRPRPGSSGDRIAERQRLRGCWWPVEFASRLQRARLRGWARHASYATT